MRGTMIKKDKTLQGKMPDGTDVLFDEKSKKVHIKYPDGREVSFEENKTHIKVHPLLSKEEGLMKTERQGMLSTPTEKRRGSTRRTKSISYARKALSSGELWMESCSPRGSRMEHRNIMTRTGK